MFTSNALGDSFNQYYAESLRYRGKLRGVPYAWNKLNALTSGLQSENYTILAGRPGTGKTTVMCQTVLTAARHLRNIDAQGVVRVITCEMSHVMLVVRMVAQLAGVSPTKLTTGSTDLAETERVREAVALLRTLPIEVLEPRSIHDTKEFLKPDTALWLVDYLQIHPLAENASLSSYEKTKKVSEAFRWFSRHVSPGIALSQLSRPTDKNESTPPTLSSLRDSGTIEQDASLVAVLHRTTPVVEDMLSIEYNLMVLKNRYGPLGTLPLVFNPATMLFEERL